MGDTAEDIVGDTVEDIVGDTAEDMVGDTVSKDGTEDTLEDILVNRTDEKTV